MSRDWTERLNFESISATKTSPNENEEHLEFSVCSFNVLAEAYCTKRSHRNLPISSAEIVFNKDLRGKLLLDTLDKLASLFDIICLQEVDDALQKLIVEHMTKLNYSYVYAPRSGKPRTSDNVMKNHLQTGKNRGARNKYYTDKAEGVADKRSDGCATFFSNKKWKCKSFDVVNFDDLADPERPLINGGENIGDTIVETEPAETRTCKPIRSAKKKNKDHPCQGIVASYKRRNAALLLELQQVQYPQYNSKNLIVANTHLYWHPGYEYVKLAQAHYLMHRIQHFQQWCGKEDTQAVIVCGDMNSKPGSVVHSYLTKAFVNASTVSPWRYHYDEFREEEELSMQMKRLKVDEAESDIDENQDPISGIDEENDFVEVAAEEEEEEEDDDDDNMEADAFRDDNVDSEGKDRKSDRPSYDDSTLQVDMSNHKPIKYYLDVTLNKFTRWLRILGQDAALETAEEERIRTGEKRMDIFDRCRKEERTLITTSKTVLLRKECPPGTYLVNPSTIWSLEEALINLLLLHGVTLYPSKFLTRCVVCNGKIVEVLEKDEQRKIFDTFGSKDMGSVDNVYKCAGCEQGFWWSDSPTSSASRVKDVCTHLLRLCLRGGVDVIGQPDFFSHVDYEYERNLGLKQRLKSDLHDGVSEVLGWLKDDCLKSPLVLRSAYANDDDDEVQPFTNLTFDFVGCLDYILYDTAIQQIGRLALPKSFRALNSTNEFNGHLLPSSKWPSDHLCIGAEFKLDMQVSRLSSPTSKSADTSNNSTSIQSAYVPEGIKHLSPNFGCDCGCVPDIPSLFQMAELRKQAKLAKLKKSLEKRTKTYEA